MLNPAVAFILLTAGLACLPLRAQNASGPANLPKPETTPIDKSRATPPERDNSLWYDLRDLEIEGKGWQDTEQFYDRLPLRAKSVVREKVWTIGQRSTGICARFVTNATSIDVRWTLRLERLGMEGMAASGVSGVDLYIRNDRGGWGWVGAARPTQNPTNERSLARELLAGWHEFLLYLPLYNGVESVEIGIAPEASIAKAPPRPADRRKSICFYGTSITEGGAASRPGMAHTAIIGRRMDRPVINLGFSGNGPMELEIARFLVELDPAVFVIDCLPNMEPAQVKERAVPFVKILRAAKPDTPIVLVENIVYQGSRYRAGGGEGHRSKNTELQKAYQQLLAEGTKNLFYIPGEALLGDDDEATVDGTHPNDLGFMRMADAMEPVIRRAIAPPAN